MKPNAIRYAATALVAWFAMVTLFAGCRALVREEAQTSSTRVLYDRAAKTTVDNMRLVVIGGAGLMVVGVVTMAFTSRQIAGAYLVGGGGAMLTIYGQISEHPYISAVIVLVCVMGGVIMGVLYLHERRALHKTEWGLGEVVKAVEKHPEVKQDVGGGDAETQAQIKEVVTPIKTKLRQAGEIQ